MNENVNPYASPELPEDGGPLVVDQDASPFARPYATAKTRAVWAMGFLSLILVGSIIFAGASWFQIDLLERMAIDEYTLQEVNVNDTRIGVIGLLLSVARIASCIAFLMWVHRIHRNLPSLGNADLRFTPGWAVGWWFVPIFSLYVPCQVMIEAWRGSDPNTVPRSDGLDRRRASVTLVVWWWALFLAMWLTRVVWILISRKALAIDGMIFATKLSIIYCAVMVLAAILAILVVHRVTSNQGKRFRLLSGDNAEIDTNAPAVQTL